MAKKKKATNASRTRFMKAMKEPVKGQKKKPRSKKSILDKRLMEEFLKAVVPGSAMGKRLNKALSKDPGKLTGEDIARDLRKKRGKARKGPAPVVKERGYARGSEYVAPDKSRVKKFKDRAKQRLKRKR